MENTNYVFSPKQRTKQPAALRAANKWSTANKNSSAMGITEDNKENRMVCKKQDIAIIARTTTQLPNDKGTKRVIITLHVDKNKGKSDSKANQALTALQQWKNKRRKAGHPTTIYPERLIREITKNSENDPTKVRLNSNKQLEKEVHKINDANLTLGIITQETWRQIEQTGIHKDQMQTTINKIRTAYIKARIQDETTKKRMVSKQQRQTKMKYVKTVVIKWKHTKGMKKNNKTKTRIRRATKDDTYKPPSSKKKASKKQPQRRSKRNKKPPDKQGAA